jgi:hypothetical protein
VTKACAGAPSSGSSPSNSGIAVDRRRHFNGDQQRLIKKVLDQARRSDPSLEAHFDRNQTNEPILVKSIENMRCHERDDIIFSMAVGQDKTGRITAQMPSPNNEGGHRRLNVVVTRATRAAGLRDAPARAAGVHVGYWR